MGILIELEILALSAGLYLLETRVFIKIIQKN